MYNNTSSIYQDHIIDNSTAVCILGVMDWVDRARQRMKQTGKKQRELMTVLDVKTIGAVGHYLNRRCAPTPDQLLALSEFLGCSLDWLLSGKGPGPDESLKTPESDPGLELSRLVSLAEYDIKKFERENDIEFTDEEIWDLLFKVVDFAASQHFSDDFVKHYIAEMVRKAKNVN